jgi:hypothetical protein
VEDIRPAGEVIREMAASYVETVRLLDGTLAG